MEGRRGGVGGGALARTVTRSGRVTRTRAAGSTASADGRAPQSIRKQTIHLAKALPPAKQSLKVTRWPEESCAA
jgi:hypothetical protein